MINVHVGSLEYQELGSIAKQYGGRCLVSDRSIDGWHWDFEFRTEQSASAFISALPKNCSGLVFPGLGEEEEEAIAL